MTHVLDIRTKLPGVPSDTPMACGICPQVICFYRVAIESSKQRLYAPR